MDGYKAAFQGSMNAYGILAIRSARWLQHVTGTGGDSEPHYWPDHCEICKEIASHVEGWLERPNTGLQADLCQMGGVHDFQPPAGKTSLNDFCWKCGTSR